MIKGIFIEKRLFTTWIDQGLLKVEYSNLNSVYEDKHHDISYYL